MAISSEVFFGADRSDRYIYSPYSATNSQETAAKFAAVLFDGDLSQLYSQEEIENLYEHHEDLIWAANQHFVIPAYIRNELSVAVERTGKTSSKTSIGDTENCDPPNHTFR